MDKGKKIIAILSQLFAIWECFLEPFSRSRLALNVRIRRINSKHALPSGYAFRAGLIPVMQVDAQNLG